ncbi:MAG: RsmG family class I SAM-dependent methyltransferase [Actinomycetota bacterium]
MRSITDPPYDHEGLLQVLTEAKRIGTIGTASCADVIAHSAWFADALPADVGRVIDLGSGAGVPGLIVAILRPKLHVTLVDRRAKCADALHRAVSVLSLGDRVSVCCDDAERLNRLPNWHRSFDAAMSRGFGPPLSTLAVSVLFVRLGGVVVVSEPPADVPDRWHGTNLAGMGLSNPQRIGSVGVFHVEQDASTPET